MRRNNRTDVEYEYIALVIGKSGCEFGARLFGKFGTIRVVYPQFAVVVFGQGSKYVFNRLLATPCVCPEPCRKARFCLRG